MKTVCHRRAFTLLEILVVLGIIAMFLALLVPFAMRMRGGGRSEVCVENMQRIGKAIKAYAADHDDQLPGPLSLDQYTVDGAGQPPRDGQLLKYIARYLAEPAGTPGARTAKNTFTFPGWEAADHATDSPVFLMNNDTVNPLHQPAWGNAEKAPLKFADLKKWVKLQGEKTVPVDLSRMWAMTEADQELAKLMQIKDPWVPLAPREAVHVNHRNALYFDMHVEALVLSTATGDSMVEDQP